MDRRSSVSHAGPHSRARRRASTTSTETAGRDTERRSNTSVRSAIATSVTNRGANSKRCCSNSNGRTRSGTARPTAKQDSPTRRSSRGTSGPSKSGTAPLKSPDTSPDPVGQNYVKSIGTRGCQNDSRTSVRQYENSPFYARLTTTASLISSAVSNSSRRSVFVPRRRSCWQCALLTASTSDSERPMSAPRSAQ